MTALNTRRLRWLGCIGLLTLGVTFGMAPVSKILATNDHEASPDTLLGNYLAGRFARGQHDTSAAAGFYEKALAKDPKNEVILKQTFRLEAAAGNWDRATPLAKKVIKGTKSHRTARFLLAVQAFREGRFQAAKDHLAAARTGPIVDLTSRLARAWIEIGEGKPNAAFKTLSQIKQADWSRFYQRYHKGLMADLAGRRDIARTELSQAFKQNPKTLRIAEAYARHAVNAGNAKLARQVLNVHLTRSTGHALSRALLRDVKAGKKPGLLVASASAGIAEVFYGIGDALTSEGSVETGSVYLRLALLLKPDFPLVHVALGEVYETVRKYERAIEAYAHVPESSPLWMNVQIRKGYSLNALKRVEEAKALLERLADKFPKETRPLDALGSIMRSHKRFAEARDYYSRAIALVRKPTKRHWALFYSRGVSYERLKQWPKAEADFKKALKLDPNKALVLNYLGYSWVDQGRNLKEAMALIRKAVKLKPDDGYFVDSLGWAYYRQGRYNKAVEHLERAVELRPDDPVINDHLGDAYWKVGRRLEAKFQWNQALSLKPEPDEEKKIKVKLAHGLQTERQTNAQVEANEKRPN
ncbi:MAG: tetratricopeptide repeat protein [Hyphomicrobiales bacterium]|nr:tetratricopeptide repeat protein [Hyphomicrobiales bacterium]